MKKVNLKNKLALNKESIAKLNNNQMDRIVGGASGTLCITCQQPTGSAWKCCQVTNDCESSMC